MNKSYKEIAKSFIVTFDLWMTKPLNCSNSRGFNFTTSPNFATPWYLLRKISDLWRWVYSFKEQVLLFRLRKELFQSWATRADSRDLKLSDIFHYNVPFKVAKFIAGTFKMSLQSTWLINNCLIILFL